MGIRIHISFIGLRIHIILFILHSLIMLNLQLLVFLTLKKLRLQYQNECQSNKLLQKWLTVTCTTCDRQNYICYKVGLSIGYIDSMPYSTSDAIECFISRVLYLLVLQAYHKYQWKQCAEWRSCCTMVVRLTPENALNCKCQDVYFTEPREKKLLMVFATRDNFFSVF